MEQLSLWDPRLAPGVDPGPAPIPPSLPCVERRSAVRLSLWLGEVLRRSVRLEFTANRSTMLSSREDGAVLLVRLHRMFLDAPEAIWWAVVAFVAHDDREAGRLLDAYIESQPPPGFDRAVAARLRPRGQCHDLTVIFAELNARYFHNASQARITWGASASRRRRRSIQLGCYVGDEHLIRIHPSLDQPFVPRPYVAWVVFHEMLHEVFGVEGDGGRRSLHPPEFTAIEESFPDYEECQRWERANLDRLLGYRGPCATASVEA